MNNGNWREILDQLEAGEIRAAYLKNGEWEANVDVKEAILAAFKAGKNTDFGGIYNGFVDKDNLHPRKFSVADNIRIVPGGTSVRRGAYVAPGVVIMPPAYINIGAYVDTGAMIDSHALVGSCAQVGRNVHLSAGAQLGGVLEPIGAIPVVVEDDCFIGANVVIVEGIRVRRGAVIAPGATLSRSIPVYDCVQHRKLAKGAPIPENAVIIPGSRPMGGDWAEQHSLHIACPLIVKYRDARSNASLELEEALR